MANAVDMTTEEPVNESQKSSDQDEDRTKSQSLKVKLMNISKKKTQSLKVKLMMKRTQTKRKPHKQTKFTSDSSAKSKSSLLKNAIPPEIATNIIWCLSVTSATSRKPLSSSVLPGMRNNNDWK